MTDKNLAPDEFESGFEAKVHRFFETFQDDFWPKNKSKVLGVVVVIAVAVGATVYQGQQSKSQSANSAEILGKGLAAINSQDVVKAEQELSGAVSQLQGVAKAKASLLLGNIQFEKGELDKATLSYEQTIKSAGSVALLASAAEHGLAAVKMDQKDYAAAVSLLGAYVAKYGRRNPTPSEMATGTFSEDLVPNVADALFKLALCQNELKQTDNAKKTLTKIVTVYGDSRLAAQAKKVLSSLS